MERPGYKEARQMILGAAAGHIDLNYEGAMVAAEALERLNKQPAMKDHERIFFALCFGLSGIFKPRDVVNLLSETIPHKRCWYYLQKWSDLGFYNYGVTMDLGWFDTDNIPARYLEILKEQDSDKLDAALVRLTAAKTIQNHTRAVFGLPQK